MTIMMVAETGLGLAMAMHVLGALHGLSSMGPHMASEVPQKYNQTPLFNDIITKHF